MALTQISTGGVKDDAVTAGKIPAGAVGSSEIAKPIDLADDEKIRLGTGNDLEIYHNGSGAYIQNKTGNIFIGSNFDDDDGGDIRIQAKYGENSIVALDDGSVELYYDNVKYFETRSDGTKTYGDHFFNGTNNYLQWDKSEDFLRFMDGVDATFGNGDDLRIYHDGSNSFIKDSGTGNLFIDASITYLRNPAGDEHLANFNSDGAVNLYHNGVLKLSTDSSGATVSGSISDSKGELRTIPLNINSSGYTLVAADAGKCVTNTSGGWTVNNNIFSAGQAVTFINNGSGDQTITQGSGVVIYNTADAATGNRTLAARGMATLIFYNASTAYISGAGLS